MTSQKNQNNVKQNEYYRSSQNNETEQIYFYAENIFYLHYLISSKFDLDKRNEGMRLHYDTVAAIVQESLMLKCKQFLTASILLREVINGQTATAQKLTV
jgi:hypothetical protein